MKVVLLAWVAVLAGCATTPAEDDPMVIKMNDLDRRLERLERVLANQSLLELSQQVQSMQAEVRSLRGALEKMEHDSGQLQNQQRDLYKDLDRRIEALKSSSYSAPPVNSPSGSLPAPGGSDRTNYQAAFDLLKTGQYEQAAGAFQQFMSTFPDSSLAGNAQYWLGESYYVMRRYPEALKAFQDVTARYGSSSKVSDAWLKIGYTQYELKDWRAAREALEKVRRDYANTAAATEAASRLEKMAAEGR